jgi:hypothetical protein
MTNPVNGGVGSYECRCRCSVGTAGSARLVGDHQDAPLSEREIERIRCEETACAWGSMDDTGDRSSGCYILGFPMLSYSRNWKLEARSSKLD